MHHCNILSNILLSIRSERTKSTNSTKANLRISFHSASPWKLQVLLCQFARCQQKIRRFLTKALELCEKAQARPTLFSQVLNDSNRISSDPSEVWWLRWVIKVCADRINFGAKNLVLFSSNEPCRTKARSPNDPQRCIFQLEMEVYFNRFPRYTIRYGNSTFVTTVSRQNCMLPWSRNSLNPWVFEQSHPACLFGIRQFGRRECVKDP